MPKGRDLVGQDISVWPGSLHLDRRPTDIVLTTNASREALADPLVLSTPTLNMRPVSREYRSSRTYNAKAVGSYTDVLEDSGVADQMTRKRRTEGTLTSGGHFPEEEGYGTRRGTASWEQTDPGGVGAQPTYGPAPRTLSPDQLLSEAMSDDELARENRRRQGLAEDPDDSPLYEYHDSTFEDTFGQRHPPLAKSTKQFLQDSVYSNPNSGRIGFSQTTALGSGPRSWEGGPEHPPIEFYDDGKVVRRQGARNQRQRALAGMPYIEYTRNIRAASFPPGQGGVGVVYNQTDDDLTLNTPHLDYRAISAELHNGRALGSTR
jgi:hypothetical protein